MSPAFVLWVVVAFIIYALSIEAKSSNSSHAIWVPLLWMLFVGSRAPSFWLDPQPTLATEIELNEGNLVNTLFLLTNILLAIIILIKRRLNWHIILTQNRQVFALVAFMLLSVIWSDYRLITIKRWVKSSASVLMVLVVLTDFSPYQSFKSIFRRCAYILIPFSFLLVKYFRDIGVAYTLDGAATMWVGVTPHKNSLGQLCFVCVFFLVWDLANRYRIGAFSLNNRIVQIDFIVLIMAIWLLKGSPTSKSQTSVMVLIIGIVLAFLFSKLSSNIKLIKFYIPFSILAATILNIIIEILSGQPLWVFIVRAIGRDATLTGRVPLWDVLLEIGSGHRFLGSGFGAFWPKNISFLWSSFIWKPTSSHNGYIGVYLNLGYVGLILLCTAILSAYTKSVKMLYSYYYSYGLFRLCMVLMVAIYNITEASYTKAQSFLWFVFLLVALDTINYTQIDSATV